jgi:delta14-sterol reductase
MSLVGRTSSKLIHKHQLTAGRLGAAGVIFGLPLVVYLSTFLCNDVSGCPAPALLHPESLTLEKLRAQTPWPENGIRGLFNVKVIGWVVAYHGLLLAMQLLLPGVEAIGTELSSGGRLKYKFNSFNSACLILAALAVGTFLQGPTFPVWAFIWDNLIQIITANLLISVAEAVFVYLRSFTVPHPGKPNPARRELAKGGHSGNMLYDFFIGRELNPRIDIPASYPLIGGQTIDIKVFNELRPGFIGWIILDLAFMAHQHEVHGFVSDSMLLLTAFQTLYVMDALYMEPAMLTTIDVTTDGFGFMLAFGDLVWLPFIYSLQCRYIAVYPLQLGVWGSLGVLAIVGVGYYIFRAANNEKNRFRTDPNNPRVSHLEYITTSTGSKLLMSGWWGMARHINYFGDWIMAFSYCLPTGISGYLIHSYNDPVTGTVTRKVEQGEARGWGMLFTYFYIVYFFVLLAHRQMRDDAKCERKYGKDWEKYTAKVKSRIIPGIY